MIRYHGSLNTIIFPAESNIVQIMSITLMLPDMPDLLYFQSRYLDCYLMTILTGIYGGYSRLSWIDFMNTFPLCHACPWPIDLIRSYPWLTWLKDKHDVDEWQMRCMSALEHQKIFPNSDPLTARIHTFYLRDSLPLSSFHGLENNGPWKEFSISETFTKKRRQHFNFVLQCFFFVRVMIHVPFLFHFLISWL